MIGTPNQGSELPAPALGGFNSDNLNKDIRSNIISASEVSKSVQSEPKPLQLGAQPLTTDDNSQQAQSTATASATSTSQTSPTLTAIATDPKAEDVDVIEKLWVDKAKKIAEVNKDNPREKSLKLASVKAEYIKSRYGKDIKVVEEAGR